MTMLWFLPFAVGIGVVGTRTTFRTRHALRAKRKDWWLHLTLAWVPLAAWAAAQVVGQY